MTFAERFLKYVEQVPNGCWVWIGSTDKDGYGLFKYNGKTLRAHRIAYRIFTGKIPKGKEVLHACDKPPCLKPDHLFLGTKQENVADRVSKNRTATGENSGKTKLTWEQVEEIRSLHVPHPDWRGGNKGVAYSARWLAKKYGVSKPVILAILRNKTWKVPGTTITEIKKGKAA